MTRTDLRQGCLASKLAPAMTNCVNLGTVAFVCLLFLTLLCLSCKKGVEIIIPDRVVMMIQ
jgi:hypothetical protein